MPILGPRWSAPTAFSHHKIPDLCRSAVGQVRGALYRHVIVIALAVAVAIAALAVLALRPLAPGAAPLPAAIPAAQLESAQDRYVLVYVDGAVAHPGMYRLLLTQRVADALVAAGGATAEADPSCMPNLAAHLKDGKQVSVPFSGRCPKSRTAKVNVNTATRAQLLTVPGMDGSLADAIIAYREQSGGFTKLAELKSELGVDAVLYKQLAKKLAAP